MGDPGGNENPLSTGVALMALTQVADIFEPTLFGNHVVERTATKSALWRSGAIVQTPEFNAIASERSRTVDLPFWQDLPGASELDSDGSAVTPAKLTDEVQSARKHLRRKAWSVSDLATTVVGSDPLLALADRFGDYWARVYQSEIVIPTLTGILFDADSPLRAGGSNPHVVDVSIADGDNAAAANKFSVANVIAATTGLLGDAFDRVGIVVMPSAVFATAQALNIVSELPLSDQDPTIIRRILGYEVIVDDGCRTVAGGTSGFVYATYFLAQGALVYGEGAPKVPAELDRDALGGSDTIVNRRHFLLHPNGCKWTGSGGVAGLSAATAEIEDGTNWGLAFESKNVGITAMLTNG